MQQLVEETEEERSAERPTGSQSADGKPDVRMGDEAISTFLERQGWGSLTLADGGDAYSVPLSFGYDGDGTLYFQLQTDEDSQKMSYFDATTTATFLVTEVQPPNWTSVMVRGEVSQVDDEEVDVAYAAFAENAWFPTCPWTAEKDPADVTFYKLEADEMSGRTSLVED